MDKNQLKLRRLSAKEIQIAQYMTSKNQKQFVRLSPYKRKRMIDTVLKQFSKRGYDLREFSEPDKKQYHYNTTKIRAIKRVMKLTDKTVISVVKSPIKAKDAYVRYKQKEVMLDKDGKLNRKNINQSQNINRERKKSSKNSKSHKIGKIIGRKMDEQMASFNRKGQSREKTIRQRQQEIQAKMEIKIQNTALKVGSKTAGFIMKILIKIVATIISALLSVLAPVLAVIAVVAIIVAIFFSVVSIEEERLEQENQAILGSYSVSDNVLAYRERILQETSEYGREDYIDLYLAVVMQESSGEGEDIFQCSESLGYEPDSITAEESIIQGVRQLSDCLAAAGVNSPYDIETIRLALQGYNFGMGYIKTVLGTNIKPGDRVIKAPDGKWTQDNVLAYQKQRATVRGVAIKRTAEEKEQLGPYRYGDAYYTTHVLRYYPLAAVRDTSANIEVSGIDINDRIKYLFPSGVPKTATEALSYMKTISVPIYDKDGNSTSMNITVHKKLENAYKNAFEGMYEIGFRIDKATTGAYNWRVMASDSNKLSYHSYGSCIDINWNSNPASYTAGIYNPIQDPLSITAPVVIIWKTAGFYWGGDWSGSYKDYMHFTYTNN